MAALRTRGPQRRALAIAGLTALVGTLAWNALSAVWFAGAFARNGELVWVNLTPRDLATYGMLEGPTGGLPATYTVAGHPATQVWLVLGIACAALAVLLRLGLFSLGGISMLWLARSSATSMYDVVMSPAANGRFTLRGVEYLNFLDLTWMLMALLGVLTVQITYANSVKRRDALRAGQEPEPGVLDVFTNIQSSIVGRYSRPTPSNDNTVKQKERNAPVA
jgi:hypothetical protein